MSDPALIAVSAALAGVAAAFGIVALGYWLESAILIRRQRLSNRQRKQVLIVLRAMAAGEADGRWYRHTDEFREACDAMGLTIDDSWSTWQLVEHDRR